MHFQRAAHHHSQTGLLIVEFLELPKLSKYRIIVFVNTLLEPLYCKKFQKIVPIKKLVGGMEDMLEFETRTIFTFSYT